MILVDTNILVYATFRTMAEHRQAREWLDRRLDDADDAVALCWPVVYAFVRVASNRAIFGPDAVSVGDAWRVADAYLDDPATRVVTAGSGHRTIAGELTATPGVRSQDVPDIEIAALAIEHGLVLATHDSGFRRFTGLRVVDPLSETAG